MLRRIFRYLSVGICWLMGAMLIAPAALALEPAAHSHPNSSASLLTSSGAYVRESIPGQNVAVGYLTVHNNGPTDRKIIAVEMSVPGVAEIHAHSHENGMMKMFRVESVIVPAKGSLVFKPGAYHLMFKQLQHVLKEGDVVVVSLVYADGFRQSVQMPVRSLLKSE